MAATETCARCAGVGFVYATAGGRVTVEPCACRSRREAPVDPLEACRIPPAHRDSTLGRFAPRTPGARAAYEKALAYCHGFPHAAPRGLGLLFWGPPGSGKTRLAVGVLTELVARTGIDGLFWDCAALVKEIARERDQPATGAGQRPLESASHAGLLLLDDLARRRLSDAARDALGEVLGSRHRTCRPTLITTALRDVSREEALAARGSLRHEEFLIERVGEGVRSKLLEMCAFVPMQSAEEGEAGRGRPGPRTLRGLRRGAQEPR